ncbi:MAG: IS66 family transposase, partial [Gammaproteobacteria bacterium]|nr:IS66 family transposase [Gammaproteobacteria bacterium]
MTMEQLLKENAELKRTLSFMTKSMEAMNKTIEAMAASSEQQHQMITQLNHTIDQLNQSNEQLNQRNEQLIQTIAELNEKLGKNSKNSSKPPSSDSFNKPKSLRKSSGKKPGGQKGHKGAGLTLVSAPDKTIVHKPIQCSGCPNEGQCTSCRKSAVRNVVDVEIKTTVTAHYTESYECPLCNNIVITGQFPESVTSSMQYGDGVKSLAIALNTEGMMSISRTHNILSAVLGLPVSTGTITTIVSKFADKVSSTVEAIRKVLLSKPVINCDETGTRTEGTNYWVHSACNDDYTYISLQKKRGKEGMDNAGFLPEYSGTIIHDFWKSYWKYNLLHGVCGAHLLRELNGVIDNRPEQKDWAEAFQNLLLDMNAAKDKAIEKGKPSLSAYYHQKFDNEYNRLMDEGKQHNPEPEKIPGKRGRTKRGKVLCLIDRLIEHKAEVCLFINDFNVSFTNNTAERSIRMVRVKTKVSGCFRTETGASEFMTIRSYLDSAKKHG